MRYLFSALLLLNIAFFVWQYQKENHEPVSARNGLPQDNTVATLTLLSEVENTAVEAGPQSAEADQEQEVNQGQLQEPQKATAFVCHTMGPFADSQSADQAASVFEEAGIAVTRREVEEKELAGYWIHLPEENDLAAARRILRDLKGRKITDISVAPLDDGRYAVSLGVFSKKSTSDSRYAQITAMGYSPVVVERFKVITTVWIDVMDIEPPLVTPAIWQQLIDKFPATSHAEITCR